MKQIKTIKLILLLSGLFFSSVVYGQLYEQFVDKTTETLGVNYNNFNFKHNLFGGFQIFQEPTVSDNDDGGKMVITVYSNVYKPGAMISICRVFDKENNNCSGIVLIFGGHTNWQLIKILINHFNTTPEKTLKYKNDIPYWYQNYNENMLIQTTMYEKMVSILNCVVVEIQYVGKK